MSLIIYTKAGCGWCAEALQFLKANNVPYEEREVLSNDVFFDELEQKSGQTKTPTLDLDGKILVDASDSEIRTWLRENGALS